MIQPLNSKVKFFLTFTNSWSKILLKMAAPAKKW